VVGRRLLVTALVLALGASTAGADSCGSTGNSNDGTGTAQHSKRRHKKKHRHKHKRPHHHRRKHHVVVAGPPPPKPPPPQQNCDPNYKGACLDPNASDYDCAGGQGDGPKYVQGPVTVVGNDHYDLNRDADNIACDQP
jgi:hypothetical protein